MIDDCDKLDRWIDSLLKSSLVEQIESPPPALVQSVANSLARRRQRRLYACCGLATAAVLAIAVSWSLTLNRRAINQPQTIASAQEQIAPAVFIGGDDVIVVPVASRYPNVTIVRVFPTYRSDAGPGTGSEPPTTTDETFESPDFNGG